MSDKTTGMSIRRLAGEAMAIFLGVAAALAGQAWFEFQLDRRAEREFLETVEEELELVDTFLSSSDQWLRGRADVASALFAITSSSDAAGSVDSLVVTARRLAQYYSAASLEPLDDVLATARLTVVDDPDLRRTLARFRSQARGLRVSMDQNQAFVLSELRGFLQEHFGFCSDSVSPEDLLIQLPCRTPSVIDPAVFPELESLVHLLVIQYGNMLSDESAVSDGLVELRTSITARLAAL